MIRSCLHLERHENVLLLHHFTNAQRSIPNDSQARTALASLARLDIIVQVALKKCYSAQEEDIAPVARVRILEQALAGPHISVLSPAHRHWAGR